MRFPSTGRVIGQIIAAQGDGASSGTGGPYDEPSSRHADPRPEVLKCQTRKMSRGALFAMQPQRTPRRTCPAQ